MRPGTSGRGRIVRLVGALSITFATTAFVTATTAVGTSAMVKHGSAKGLFHSVYAGVNATGELDCNGYSPVQKPARYWNCTDIRSYPGDSNANSWDGRFYDNNHYIGHDEPDATFISNKPGSGDNVTWTLTLGKDPAAAPTATDPGHDVSHYFELTPAPWLSMALCDPNSDPLLPCTADSDSNAPSGSYPGAGSAFMEMQFYPPGEPPFVDSTSCNDKYWCAALTLDSLECTQNFTECNGDCEEPLNASFIQTNGIPAEPPGPQDYPDNQYTNAETLMMSPGDRITVHVWDAPVPGEPGQKALEAYIKDLTTGKTGYIQASAKNGFEDTSFLNCNGIPFNFQPEYSTASVGNYIPWAALQTNISTEFETGHFESCASLAKPIPNPISGMPSPGDGSQTYNECVGGPYEASSSDEGSELGDAFCWNKGDTHPGYAGTGSVSAPDEMTGCQDDVFQNGDLDYDGEPYWAEWPTSASATKYPSSFVEALPTTNGSAYSKLFFQTDAALSESECTASGAGCTVPPVRVKNGKSTPTFYPYWSEVNSNGTCSLEFGNVSSGADTFGKDLEYGTQQFQTLGYPEFMAGLDDNTCDAVPSEGYFLVGKSGHVVSGGDAPPLPSVHTPAGHVVGIVASPSGKGYFAVTNTGAIYTEGDAVFQGDLTTLPTPASVDDIVAIAPTADGKGYWLIGADGGEFAFGDAAYHGSVPGLHIHVHDIVGMVTSPNGGGYIVVGSDGGVFAFGSAHFHGSLPGDGVHVNDIRAVLPSQAGTGYVLVGSDGGAFVFGTGVPYHGSLPGRGIKVSDIVGIALTAGDGGYWMAGSNGSVYAFGDARPLAQSVTSADLPITAITGVNTGASFPAP